MTLYTNTISITGSTLTVSLAAVTYPIRLLSASSSGVTATFSAYVVASPTFSGTTNFTPLPTRQGAPDASFLVRVNGTQGGTAVRFGVSDGTSIKPEADMVVSPGSSFRFDAVSGVSGVIYVTYFAEELRQLSWPL